MFTISRGHPSLQDAVSIAVAGFVRTLSPELRRDVDLHLRQGQITYRITRPGHTLGFALFNLWGDVLYLNGIILRPEIQGLKIGQRVIELAQIETRARHLALRTQSPIMWQSGKNVCREKGGWFPNPEKIKGKWVGTVGARVILTLGGTFPIAIGQYKGPLYGQKPIHRNPAIQKWWDSICDFERGDAVVCVGSF